MTPSTDEQRRPSPPAPRPPDAAGAPDAAGPSRAPTPSGAERFLQETSAFYVVLDDDGVVRRWNRAAERLFGYAAAEAVGRSLDRLIVPPSLLAAHHAGIDRFRHTGYARGLQHSVEVDAVRADGTTVPVELSIWAEETADGHVFHALGHDVSARRESQRLLEVLAAHRQGLLLSETPDEARQLLCDTVRTAVPCQGVYLYEPVSPSTLQLTAQSLRLASPGRPLVPVDDRLARTLATQGPGRRLLRRRLDDSAAADALRETALSTFVVTPLHSARPRPKQECSLVGVLVLGWFAADRAASPDEQRLIDLLVSEAVLVFDRLQAQEELHRAARTDVLTGLGNRRAFDEALQTAAREHDPVGLVVLDLDRFKAYNDAHGHPAGDALLESVAAAWLERLDGVGELFRIGGDEFAVVLPSGTSTDDVARQLVEATPPAVGTTSGVASMVPGEEPSRLLHRADVALYAGKRAR